MDFKNYTPFPAIGWPTMVYDENLYLSMVVRVKYLFDSVDKNGFWSLKLDPKQGDLFGQDIFYNEDDIHHSSIRFESDYVSYKPHADLIINAYAHASVPLPEWECGVKVLRKHKYADEQPPTVLLEKWLNVRGERNIQEDLVGFSFTKSKESQKVALRYENANGGMIENPKYTANTPSSEQQYLIYNPYNPIGVGVVDKIFLEKETLFRAPQIESVQEPINKPNMPNPPEGFGFIGRSWKPRIDYAGTFDDTWIKERHPFMPDDYKEEYNNAAHPDLQLKGYFEPYDKIIFYNLVKDRYEQSFNIPNFHFKGSIDYNFKQHPFYLNIDTVIVDILDEDMQNNAVYVSYRTRIPSSKDVTACTLNMIVPKEFLGEAHGQ
ncbi:MAG: DUF2169 domain-containing protein [Sulfurovum sp.]|nr:DUF2169 domain-containing protein [Sulfurovum sp.]